MSVLNTEHLVNTMYIWRIPEMGNQRNNRPKTVPVRRHRRSGTTVRKHRRSTPRR